jgi:hypothetical protein
LAEVEGVSLLTGENFTQKLYCSCGAEEYFGIQNILENGCKNIVALKQAPYFCGGGRIRTVVGQAQIDGINLV